MPDIQDYIGMNDIKGELFDKNRDSLYSINQRTMTMANQTEMVRADTGELNGTAINDLYVTNNLTLTGNITVKNLYVLDGATINGNFIMTVNENAYVYSSHIDIGTLDVKGDLIVKRKVGDILTTNLITLGKLIILGPVSISDCNLSVATMHVEEELTLVNSTCNIQLVASKDVHINGTSVVSGSSVVISGNCNLSNNGGLSAPIVAIGGDLNALSSSVISSGATLTVNGNVYLEDITINQGPSDYFEVQGDCVLEDVTINLITHWRVHHTLTMNSLNCTYIENLEATNFNFSGSELTIAGGSPNNILSGRSGGSGGRDTSSTEPLRHGGSGGGGAYANINISNTFTSTTLTDINLVASDGDPGEDSTSSSQIQERVSPGGGGGGGSVYCDLFFNITNFSNIVNINLEPGLGGFGGRVSTYNDYVGGRGAHGTVAGLGSAGNNGAYGHAHCGGGGGASVGSVYNAGGLGYIYQTSHSRNGHNGGAAPATALKANIKVTTEVDKSYYLNIIDRGSNGVTTEVAQILFPIYTLSTSFSPLTPELITESNSINISSLLWKPPVILIDSEITLDFTLEIQQQFTEKIFQTIVVSNTNDNAEDFSGTPPYAQGSGNITYTLPVLPAGTYRWRVKTLKDLDITKESLFTDWRIFTIS